MGDSFDFTTPDLFTAGTIGPPGQRVFYLQAREGNALVTLKCEKEQVRVLGEYLGRLLERLAAPEGASVGDLALVEPVTPAWAIGSIGVGYDEGTDRVVLVIEEAREEDAAAEAEEEATEEAEPETEAAPEPEGEEEEVAESDRASGRVSRGIMSATGLDPLKPYSFQRSDTFCSTARSMKISFGLFFHSNGVQASRRIRLVISRASIGRPGSSGV